MKDRVKYFDKLRVLAILDIILLHVLSIFRYKYFQVDTVKYMVISFVDAFTRVGVPIFFMLTGSLMLEKKIEIKKYKEYFKTRIAKLLIAYILFGIIYFVYEASQGTYSFSLFLFLTKLTDGTIEYHLWFMPVILLINMMLPFLKKLVENLDKKELEKLILGLFLFGNCFKAINVLSTAYYHSLLENFVFPNLLIYTNYIFIGYYLKKEEVTLNKKKKFLSILSILLIPIASYMISRGEMNEFFFDSMSPLVVLPSITVFTWFKNKKWSIKEKLEKFLSNQSNNIFYIYLVHVLILKVTDKILGKEMLKTTGLKEILYIVIYFGITVIGSFLVANLITILKKWILKHKEKITSILTTIFYFVFGCILLIIFVNFIGNFYHTSKINYGLFLLGIIVFAVFFSLLFRHQEKIFQNKHLNRVLLVIYLLLQGVILYYFQVKPSWDFGQIYDIAVRYALGKGTPTIESYLYLCDNNIAIATILSILYKAFSLIGIKNHFLEIGFILNLICIDISHYFTYKIIEKCNEKYSKPYLVFMLVFTPLLFYLPIFYTDTLTMPFVAISLYSLYNYFFLNQKKHYIMITGLLIGIGGVIKPTILIIFVAVLIYCLLKENKKIDYYFFIPVLLICVSIPFLGYKWYVNEYFDEERLYEESLPMNHFIMMGLSENGGFNGEDYDRTISVKGKEEKSKICTPVIKERLKMRKKDFLSFYNRKISYTWADSSFFVTEKLTREPIHKEVTKYIRSEEDDKLFWMISNTEWFLVLGLMILGVIHRKYLLRESQDFHFLLSVSIFGLFLFLLIWETRSRYILNFTPLFMISAYLGLVGTINRYKQKKGRSAKK